MRLPFFLLYVYSRLLLLFVGLVSTTLAFEGSGYSIIIVFVKSFLVDRFEVLVMVNFLEDGGN